MSEDINLKMKLWYDMYEVLQKITMESDMLEEVSFLVWLEEGAKDNEVMKEKTKNELHKTYCENSFYLMAESRAKTFGVSFTNFALAMISDISDRPGQVVMWIGFYSYRAKVEGLSEVTAKYVSEVLKKGILTEDSRKVWWDAQKIGGQNMLDMVEL